MGMNTQQGSWKSVRVSTTPTPLTAPPKTIVSAAHNSPNRGANAVNAATLKNDLFQPRVRLVTDPKDLPTETVKSTMIPVRNVSQPPHQYGRNVDSRAGAKRSGGSVNSATSAKGTDRSAPPLQFVGSTFAHIPNAPNRPYLPLPANAKLAKPYQALTPEYFSSSQPLMHNRTAAGLIVGSPQNLRKQVPAEKVPELPPDEPLGPDNPYKAINDTWTACWDSEAGATYYYNQVTGEATWIPPEIT